jgi:CobQ/CobB/MinD/ParA family nucleotide binding protein
MLVFAASDKGGTGRSVTTTNIAYRCALAGKDVCYVDFDFGSPTAGAVFNLDRFQHGTKEGGVHSYLLGAVATPVEVDVFAESDRLEMRDRPPGAGRLALLPGDSGTGEFPSDTDVVRRCSDLFDELDSQFDVTFVDLSAGRSYAAHMALAATHGRPRIKSRWLVFHRWTQQHIIGAASLVHGEQGIVQTGTDIGHDPDALLGSIRFVRTAIVDPDAQNLTAEQTIWINECDVYLRALARDQGAGKLAMLGSVPLDPLLQWREQLITGHDLIVSKIAHPKTAEAFEELARLVLHDHAWDQP